MSGFVVRPETVPGPTHVRTGKVRDLRTAVDGHPVVGGDCVFGVTPTGARVGSELEGRHRSHFRTTWWSTLWIAVSRPTSV